MANDKNNNGSISSPRHKNHRSKSNPNHSNKSQKKMRTYNSEERKKKSMSSNNKRQSIMNLMSNKKHGQGRTFGKKNRFAPVQRGESKWLPKNSDAHRIYTLIKISPLEDIKHHLEKNTLIRFQPKECLHAAVQSQRWDVIRWLVDEKKMNPTTRFPKLKSKNILMIASECGELATVEWLLGKEEVDANIGNYENQTALMFAAGNQKWDVVRYLLENAATPDKEESSFVILSAAIDAQWVLVEELAKNEKFLFDINVTTPDDQSLLILAASAGKWNLVKLFIQECDANISQDGNTAVHLAAENESWDMVKWLGENGANLKNRGLDDLKSVTFLVASKKQWELLEWMITEKGVDYDVPNSTLTDMSPIYLATIDAQWRTVKSIISSRRIRDTELSGLKKSLDHVATIGNLDMVKFFLKASPRQRKIMDLRDFMTESKLSISSPVQKKNVKLRPFGMSSMLKAAGAGQWHVVEWLLMKYPADFRKTPEWTRTRQRDVNLMLGMAADSGNLFKVKWLVSQGANYRSPHRLQASVPARAALAGHFHIVKWFLQGGCGGDNGETLRNNCVGINGEPLLHLLARDKKWKWVEWVLANVGQSDIGFSVDEQDKQKKTLLMIACKQGNLQVVSWLVGSYFATINQKDDHGNTALVIAAINEKWKIVRWFLCDGQNKGKCAEKPNNIASKEAIYTHKSNPMYKGYTVMGIACAKGLLDEVQFLYDHRCIVNPVSYIDDDPYYSALEVSCKFGMLDVVKWLYYETQIKIPPYLAAIAAENGKWEMLKWASQVPEVDINQKADLEPAVLIAAKKQVWEIVEYLIVNCSASEQVMRTLRLIFESQNYFLMMRIFVSMLMDWGDDIIISKFKRVLPFFYPKELGKICKIEADNSDSPISVCLALAYMFGKLAKADLVNKEEYINLKDEFSQTASLLLEKLSSDRLAMWILEAGEEYWDPMENDFMYEPANSPMKLALKFEDLEFIGGARLNRIVAKWWGNDKQLNKSFANNPHKLFRTPAFKMVLDHTSFCLFLALFLIVIFQNLDVTAPINNWEIGLFSFTITYFWREMRELKINGCQGYWQYKSNWVDMTLCISIFFYSIIRSLPISPDSTYEPVASNLLTLCIMLANCGMMIRFTMIFIIFPSIGTLIISILKMAPQIGTFLILFLVLQSMFFISFIFIAKPFSEGGIFLAVVFKIANLILSSFAQEYLEIEGFEDKPETPPTEIERYILLILVLLFLFGASLVFINLLIAIMARIYAKVFQKSVHEYSLQRVTFRYVTYDQSYNVMVPPFNVVADFFYGIYLIFHKLDKLCNENRAKNNIDKDENVSLPEWTMPQENKLEPNQIGKRNSTRMQNRIEIKQRNAYILMKMKSLNGVDLQDRTWRLTKYRKCFIGEEAITWMIENKFAPTREEAVEIGEALRKAGSLEHVANDQNFKDGLFFL